MINERDHSALIDAMGSDTIVYPDVEFLIENHQHDGRGITIGSQCCIYPRNRFVLGDMGTNRSADLTIGNYVLINAGGYLSGEGGLTICDYALIGPNVCILSAGHVYRDPATPIRRQPLTYGAITIGRDAWIGGGSVVLQGVSVGAGAIVGAGSVVTEDIPPNAVAVGNPARIMKYRGAPLIEKTKYHKIIDRLKTIFLGGGIK